MYFPSLTQFWPEDWGIFSRPLKIGWWRRKEEVNLDSILKKEGGGGRGKRPRNSLNDGGQKPPYKRFVCHIRHDMTIQTAGCCPIFFRKKERGARVNLVKALSSFCNRVRLWCCRCQLSVALNFNKNNPIRTLLLRNFQKNEARQKKSFCLTLNSIWLNSGSRPKTLFNFLKK